MVCELCVYDPLVKAYQFKTFAEYQAHMKEKHGLDVVPEGGRTWKPVERREKREEREE